LRQAWTYELGEGIEIAGAGGRGQLRVALHPATLRARTLPSPPRIEEGVELISRLRVGSCEQTERLLSDYLDNGLRGLRRGRVRRHLDRCPLCRALLLSLSRTVEQLRSLGRVGPLPSAPSLADAVIDRIRREGVPAEG
jgi:hypothetical protein